MSKASKNTLAKDLTSCALGLVALIFLIEIIMRIAGQGILAEQESNNEIYPEDANMLRIAAIGSSTSADYIANKIQSWPRQLEKKLKEQGIPARVYNLARTAATTAKTLGRLPEQLDQFKPQLVIAMMGRNDRFNFLEEDTSWWSNLRLVKLYHYLRLGMRRGPDEFPPENFDDPRTTQQIYEGLKSKDPRATIERVEARARQLSPVQRAQYYYYIGQILESAEQDPHHENSTRMFRLSLDSKFQAGQVLTQTMYGYIRTGQDDECLKLAEIYVDHDWVVHEFLLRRLSQCALVSVQKNSPLVKDWRKIFEKLNPGYNFEENDRGDDSSIKNYRKTFLLLKSRNIRLVAMQFPTLPLESLKDYFKSETGNAIDPEFKDIIFVENRANFAEARKKYSYDELFFDKLNDGDFGHTTTLGHSLIADTAVSAVQEYLKQSSGLSRGADK